MKHFLFALTVLLSAFAASASLPGNGYYRLQNRYTERYARLRDGYGRVDIASMSADMDALQTVRPYEECLSDPASILNLVSVPSGGYEICCQGMSLFSIIGYYIQVAESDGYYQAYAERSGMRIYLADDANGTSYLSVVAKFLAKSMDITQRDWNIIPVNNEDGHYLGVAPKIHCTINDKYYSSYYTSFAYSLKSQGMKAYYITSVDEDNAIAVYKEITFPDIPANTPVFLECSSSEVSQNRLDVHGSYYSSPSDNILKGVFFSRVMKKATNPHNFYVRNDTATIRVLGMKADGSVGFIVSKDTYLPENSSYLTVSPQSPSEFSLMTPDEYKAFIEEKTKPYILSYYVDSVFYAADTLLWGDSVIAMPDPVREGHTFSGWNGLPLTMPKSNVNVYGSFSVNFYELNYILDGETYKSYSLAYGAPVTAEAAPEEREGHTFSGWSGIPSVMPAHNVTVTGSFIVNHYDLTYLLDGELYRQYSVAYGAPVTAEADPEGREGHTFSGWSGIPSVMPAHEVTVTGSFTVNYYDLSYLLDGELYRQYSVAFGDSIAAEPAPVRQGYVFSGWSEIPAVMPSHDVTVNGTFAVGLQTTMSEVESVRYFTLYGQELDSPVEGVLVVVTKYKDGSVVRQKSFFRR